MENTRYAKVMLIEDIISTTPELKELISSFGLEAKDINTNENQLITS